MNWRIAALDYWRAVAILLVIVGHYDLFTVNLGRVGVSRFFVLSGFLVSRPLVGALRSGAPIPWRRFTWARAKRILPSYYAFLFIAPIILKLFISNANDVALFAKHLVPSFLFFYKNQNQDFAGASGHLRTLGVEEHFYLALPLLVLLSRGLKRRSLVPALIFLCMSALVLRTYLAVGGNIDPAAAHINFDLLAFGTLLRYAVEACSGGIVQISGLYPGEFLGRGDRHRGH